MPRKKITKNDELTEKLEYIGLDLENIPDEIIKYKPLKYKAPKIFNEKQQYKQYKFIPVADIQIMLTPTNRMDDLQEKYKKAKPIGVYLDNKTEENIPYHATFLNMLKQVRIEEIKEIEKEQKRLSEKLPFKIKFERNYLWQIYYSEITNKYFMLVPTEDSDYSTFFYLLKRKIENIKDDKVFVPISSLNYSEKYFTKSEINDIENYLWLFTKDWPLIYEVYDKQNRFSMQIVGETNVFEEIKSLYKITLKTTNQAMQFYKLLKAMFILQTEVPNYYNFSTNINKAGGIDFYSNDQKLEYMTLPTFLKNEYMSAEEKKVQTDIKNKDAKERLEKLKSLISNQEMEYIEKEKQISTFLECKKTFFGKFKYYFKYNKKSRKNRIKSENNISIKEIEKEKKTPKIEIDNKKWKKNYTIEELVEKCKELEEYETELKNTIMDINAFKLKSKNLAKKIENATLYIQEIDKHKKSIFEFWKYSNKDEIEQLPEGEEEEINIIKKITKVFNYKEDLEEFGKKLDIEQRKILSKEELDSCYIATTELLEILNKLKTNAVLPKDVEISLRTLKKHEQEEKNLSVQEDFDIFGGMVEDSRKIRKIGNQRHREVKKDKYNVLEINQTTKTLGYKLTLEKVLNNIKKALEKNKIKEQIPVYKAMCDEKIKRNTLQLVNINPEEEIQNLLKSDAEKLYLYKINLTEETNAIGITNSCLYDNQNKTLPIGMDLSTKCLIDIGKLPLVLKRKSTFRIIDLENKDDFADTKIKNICLLEYELDEEKRKERIAKKQKERKFEKEKY